MSAATSGQKKTATAPPKSSRPAQQERVRIQAAKLRVVTDRKLGYETPEWIVKLAEKSI